MSFLSGSRRPSGAASLLGSLVLLVSCGEPAADPPPLRPESVAEEIPPTPEVAAPSAVESPSDAIGVAGGEGFSCALQRAGRVACWGHNELGQLGQLHSDAIEGAVFVHDLTDAVAIAAELGTACALRRNGRVVCWGDNRQGGRGNGDDSAIRGPFEVPGIEGATSISADRGFCASRPDALYCWGTPERRLMRTLPPDARLAPPTPMSLPGITRIRSGTDRRLGFGPTGAHAWTHASDPVPVPNVRDVVASSSFECLQHDDGSVECRVREEPSAPVDSLRGALGMVTDARGYITARMPSGELAGYSVFDRTLVGFEASGGVVALARGREGPLTAGPGDRLREWSATGPSRTATVIPWPTEEAGRAAFPEGPIPRFCTIEAEVLPVETEGTVAEVSSSLFRDEEGGVPDIASLCRAAGIQPGSLDCPQSGPWLAWNRWGDYGDLAFFRAAEGARLARFPRIAQLSQGTEEAISVERFEVRPPGGAYLDVSEMSQSCEGDLCGLGTDTRVHYFMELLSNGGLLVVSARIADLRATRALGLVAANALFDRGGRIEVDQTHVNVWACGGHTRLSIPAPEAAAAEVADAVEETSSPPATPEEAAAAAETCSAGWARFGEGDLVNARLLVEQALLVLARAGDPRGQRAYGACLYNRGRLAEASGDADEAAQFYRRSLAVRPNPSVEARLAGLTAGAP